MQCVADADLLDLSKHRLLVCGYGYAKRLALFVEACQRVLLAGDPGSGSLSGLDLSRSRRQAARQPQQRRFGQRHRPPRTVR